MMYKARKYLPRNALLTLYHSFIYPYFTYCNHIWGATYRSNLRKLIRLQNSLVRMICNVRKLSSVDKCYAELGILKFTDINKYLIARFMFRFCNDQVPDLFKPMFILNRDIHDHKTRTADHFHLPVVKTELGKTGIRFRGASIWNQILSKKIHSDTSECIFVKYLKKIISLIT